MGDKGKRNTGHITSKADIEKNEKAPATIEDNEPVVAGTRIVCSNQCENKIKPIMILRTPSNDDKNGNMSLKDTDTLFKPPTFGKCKSQGTGCKPEIEGNMWQGCEDGDSVMGRPSVTMDSYMVCIHGGKITVYENGQIPASNILYGQELSAEEIEELVIYILNKVNWNCEDDINNAEYIAKCMKAAGMDSRWSIEFFLLTCCPETGRGANLLQVGGSGRGFIQLTGLTSEQWVKLGEKGNEWRVASGKDAIKWKDEKPTPSEVKDAAIKRDELAWEGAIYYWCILTIAESGGTPLNDYVAGYEDGSKGECARAGLYFAVQCYVNGAKSGGPTSEIRAGNINDYIIVENPDKDKSKDEKDYQIVEANNVLGEKWPAPNGTVERAKVYMEYYDEEEYIWNFSEDIKDNWDALY